MVETPIKAHGNVVGFIGFDEFGELHARADGEGWQRVETPPPGVPSGFVSAVLTQALSDRYDEKAGYL